jgi:plastocyanin
MRITRFLPVLALLGPACEDAAQPVVVDFVAEGTTFTPLESTIVPARIVQVWGFRGGPHNVTWEDGAPASGNLTGGTYSRDFTAAAAGTYRFRCTLHSTDFTTGMVGRVIKP